MGGARCHITFYQIPRGWRNGCRLLFFYDHCPTGSLVGSGDYSRIGVDFNLYLNSSIEINRSLLRMTYPYSLGITAIPTMKLCFCQILSSGLIWQHMRMIKKHSHYENFHKSGFSINLCQSHRKNKKARKNPRFYRRKKLVNPYLTITLAPISARL